MASDDSMNILSSSVQEDEYDHGRDDTDDGFGYDQLPQPHNLSRLSVCTSSMYTNEDEDEDDGDDVCDGMRMFMSRLSIESFDADEELSDEKDGIPDLSSDSDEEPGCYSLPSTPPRRRHRISHCQGLKEYASENEAQKGIHLTRKDLRRRRGIRERWAHSSSDDKSRKREEEGNVYVGMGSNGYYNSFSGDSESGGGGGGVLVITRPKGGRRSLCMDLDEVKACRDLGFELEHERMLEMPSLVSLSGSTLETSSGGNSPIANWRISSPGDDPRDVKARLKVWAQAVALASAYRHGGL